MYGVTVTDHRTAQISTNICRLSSLAIKIQKLVVYTPTLSSCIHPYFLSKLTAWRSASPPTPLSPRNLTNAEQKVGWTVHPSLPQRRDACCCAAKCVRYHYSLFLLVCVLVRFCSVEGETTLLKGHSDEKIHMFFLVQFSRDNWIQNIFNTLSHKIIYDKRDIWINKMLILAIAFINGNLMTSLFLL